ncbi:predicted protein [Chaetomium globosum CBS 148.51]|uniref:Uncharacterized protein n=1 Tax=Chaetomium globosum (strain ATCC 6205 / CBS 148.51 / DSM 1962 / NBRC 6347 / NRRL 1970) TaxID=306901 RepID=Q2HFY4_CHAGB|nr:uncharacterized protein CHGG_00870 [Chaetomium globosum CBS 148.51]EAQ92635.1 predicted protein [Chaetomium globosum CBS 148.51]
MAAAVALGLSQEDAHRVLVCSIRNKKRHMPVHRDCLYSSK